MLSDLPPSPRHKITVSAWANRHASEYTIHDRVYRCDRVSARSPDCTRTDYRTNDQLILRAPVVLESPSSSFLAQHHSLPHLRHKAPCEWITRWRRTTRCCSSHSKCGDGSKFPEGLIYFFVRARESATDDCMDLITGAARGNVSNYILTKW